MWKEKKKRDEKREGENGMETERKKRQMGNEKRKEGGKKSKRTNKRK